MKQLLLFISFYLLLFATGLSNSVAGRVVDEKLQPIARVAVVIGQTGTITDENGEFTVEGLTPGQYRIELSCLGYEPLVKEIVVSSGLSVFLELKLKEHITELATVVVSATRSERELSELPVPITVINREQISSMGSLRLNDVLSEQTGLTLVSDHGTGVQVQGFDPEYTLILIDGEPLIGRSAGTLDLNRISVGNIKQVEIMKGPSSSLYGSEALAGVVNIITDKPEGKSIMVSGRYGTNNTIDLSSSVNYKVDKFGLYAFVNRFSTAGYDLSPDEIGATVNPFSNYTFNTKITFDLSEQTKLSSSFRYFEENQESLADIGGSNDAILIVGKGKVHDWNINPTLAHQFSDRLLTTFRLYASSYSTNSELEYKQDSQLYESTYYDQRFLRPEIQNEIFIHKNNILTLGGGTIWESVQATRYDNTIRYRTDYIYVQDEWRIGEKLNLNLGGRWDHHTAYGSQISPKVSAQYDWSPKVSIRGSYGVGFKAPDFRQLYLNFTNATVGYSVLGANELQSGIARLQAEGQIDEILIDPSSFGSIQAENSVAYNLGVKIKPDPSLSISVNAFHNNVSDLIDTRAVARKTNGQFVYSYYNLHEVFTQGLESEFSWEPQSTWLLSIGYQYLNAKDKEVLDQLDRGEVFARDTETQVTRRVGKQEYGGLFNRSKHMANAKVFYHHDAKGLTANVRVVYRGRYGFADRNNNEILDADNEYVDGYFNVNISTGKEFNNGLAFKVGCDNLLNYTDAEYISTLSGRLLWISASYTWNSKKNK